MKLDDFDGSFYLLGGMYSREENSKILQVRMTDISILTSS